VLFSEGDFFGELELLKPYKYGFNSKTIVASKICTLTKDEIKNIIMKDPEIGVKILEAIAERLSKVESLVQNLATNDADSRMAYLIIDLMEKYGENIDGKLSIKIPLPREEMANYIGVMRETISRKLKSLKMKT
jgi:CRP-like cAMP-binding protein